MPGLYGDLSIAGIALTGLAEPNPLPLPVRKNVTRTHRMRRGSNGAGLLVTNFLGSHVSYQEWGPFELPYLTGVQLAALQTLYDNGTKFTFIVENTSYEVKFATDGLVATMYRDNSYGTFYKAVVKMHVLSQSTIAGSGS